MYDFDLADFSCAEDTAGCSRTRTRGIDADATGETEFGEANSAIFARAYVPEIAIEFSASTATDAVRNDSEHDPATTGNTWESAAGAESSVASLREPPRSRLGARGSTGSTDQSAADASPPAAPLHTKGGGHNAGTRQAVEQPPRVPRQATEIASAALGGWSPLFGCRGADRVIGS